MRHHESKEMQASKGSNENKNGFATSRQHLFQCLDSR